MIFLIKPLFISVHTFSLLASRSVFVAAQPDGHVFQQVESGADGTTISEYTRSLISKIEAGGQKVTINVFLQSRKEQVHFLCFDLLNPSITS